MSDIAISLPRVMGEIPHDFESASRAVLRFLKSRLGFGLWMVARTEGEDWIVIHAEDQRYGIRDQTVFRWADSFCSRMVAGLGPRVAPRAASVAAYAEAPIAAQLEIGAYIGIPIHYADGSLFGTLCAIDPLPQPDSVVLELPLVEILAQMLSGLLNAELQASEAARNAEHARVEAETDAMTGLYNRRGWSRFLEEQDIRRRRYAESSAILCIDLDHLKAVNDTRGHAAGDAVICKAAETIRKAVRETDIVARLGGDEFGILARGCRASRSQVLAQHVASALASAAVGASIGLAVGRPGQGIRQAWEEADRAMYRDKARR